MILSPSNPLREVAPVRIDDTATQRLWRGVVARRAAQRTGTTRTLALVWLAVGAITGALLTSGVYWAHARAAHTPATAVLALSNGRPLAAAEAPASSSRELSLSDGSKIVLGPAAFIELLENESGAVSFLLSRGEVTFDVRPGGARRWAIECGLATVEVIGTRFTIRRSPERLVVQVSRGVVLVRGERVADRVRRLEAGAVLEIASPAATSSPAASPSLPSATAHSAAKVMPALAGWRELSTRGEYRRAYELLGQVGIGAEIAESRRIDDLLALADVARLSGHPSEAIAPLSRVVAEFQGDRRSALAAFTLGKIRLSEPGSGAAAAANFRAALRLGLPASLVEDASANVVEALRRAGDEPSARAAAFEYIERFPTSARAAALRAWASER